MGPRSSTSPEDLAPHRAEKRSSPFFRLAESIVKRIEFRQSLRHAPHKNVHAFDWGLDHLGLEARAGSSRAALAEFTEHYLAHSAEYFVPDPPKLSSFDLKGSELTFPSPVTTFHAQNNTASCRYFHSAKSDAAVLVIPHWNGRASTYDKLCRVLNFFGYTALWLSLPFHGRRGDRLPPEWATSLPSTLMVTADIGLTLVTLRQAVQDALCAVTWLQQEKGHEQIGVLGASIGSCAAFLASAHDPRIKGFFANLMSSHFGEVVWTGISTRHVRESVEPHLDLEGLREAWMLNSPIAFASAVNLHNPGLRQHIVSGRFDTTFEFYLTQRVIRAFERERLDFSHTVFPCGHYTLGAIPFQYFDVYLIWRFFRDLFKP